MRVLPLLTLQSGEGGAHQGAKVGHTLNELLVSVERPEPSQYKEKLLTEVLTTAPP